MRQSGKLRPLQVITGELEKAEDRELGEAQETLHLQRGVREGGREGGRGGEGGEGGKGGGREGRGREGRRGGGGRGGGGRERRGEGGRGEGNKGGKKVGEGRGIEDKRRERMEGGRMECQEGGREEVVVPRITHLVPCEINSPQLMAACQVLENRDSVVVDNEAP